MLRREHRPLFCLSLLTFIRARRIKQEDARMTHDDARRTKDDYIRQNVRRTDGSYQNWDWGIEAIGEYLPPAVGVLSEVRSARAVCRLMRDAEKGLVPRLQRGLKAPLPDCQREQTRGCVVSTQEV